MLTIWTYTLIAVIVVSLISLVGVFTLSIGQEKLEKFLIYLVSLSAGTLLGDAFIHLIPEAYDGAAGNLAVSLYVLSGITAFFVMEKFVHWRHCHHVPSEHHPHPFSYTILIGDGLHNFVDGLIIAAGFIVSIPIGIATAMAVIFHEIPHEIGNFGSLIYGGIPKIKALFYNFLSALTAVAGALIVLIINFDTIQITNFLVPFAAGGFIYVASSDIIPELHKNTEPKKSLGQLAFFILGIGLMAALLILG